MWPAAYIALGRWRLSTKISLIKAMKGWGGSFIPGYTSIVYGLLETVTMVTDQNACNINNYANTWGHTVARMEAAVNKAFCRSPVHPL